MEVEYIEGYVRVLVLKSAHFGEPAGTRLLLRESSDGQYEINLRDGTKHRITLEGILEGSEYFYMARGHYCYGAVIKGVGKSGRGFQLVLSVNPMLGEEARELIGFFVEAARAFGSV